MTTSQARYADNQANNLADKQADNPSKITKQARNAIVFIEYSYNRYSLATLTGVLEVDKRLEKMDILFLRAKKKKTLEDEANRQLAKNIVDLALGYDNLVVAISFHTPNVIAMGTTITLIRQHLEDAKLNNVTLIAGGPHPAGDPIGTLHMGTDVVIVGEGEVALPEFLDRLFSNQPYTDVLGLAFFEGAESEDGRDYKFTGRPKPIDLSDYPPFAPKYMRFSPIEIGRGCPWACKFCQTPFLMGGRMRFRSVESTLYYAEIGHSKGFKDVRFTTPVSFAYGSEDGRSVNLPAIEELLKPLSKLFGKEHVYFGSFPSEVRPENISAEALTLVQKYCGNDNLIIGAQSGSERMLKAIHRGHGTEDVIRAAQLILDFNMTANVDFIYGMPGETEEDIEDTKLLIEKLTSMGARVHSHSFMPLVGTPFSDQAPGKVDEGMRNWLEQLRGKGLEYGNWKSQEIIAEESTTYMAEQEAQFSSSKLRKNPTEGAS